MTNVCCQKIQRNGKQMCTRVYKMRYQIFHHDTKKGQILFFSHSIIPWNQRFYRRKKNMYNLNIQFQFKEEQSTRNYSVPSSFQETFWRLFFLPPPKKWSRFLVFNNHTRVAVFIKAMSKRLLSWRASRRVSTGHPAGKPIISPSVCAGVSPTSPWISLARKCSL